MNILHESQYWNSSFLDCVNFRYVVFVDGNFIAVAPKPTMWFHVVVNFIGPNDGQGLRIYYDGVAVENRSSDPSRRTNSRFSNLDRRILIGRLFYIRDDYYASVVVDELFFFNQALTEPEITRLSQNRQYL